MQRFIRKTPLLLIDIVNYGAGVASYPRIFVLKIAIITRYTYASGIDVDSAFFMLQI